MCKHLASACRKRPLILCPKPPDRNGYNRQQAHASRAKCSLYWRRLPSLGDAALHRLALGCSLKLTIWNSDNLWLDRIYNSSPTWNRICLCKKTHTHIPWLWSVGKIETNPKLTCLAIVGQNFLCHEMKRGQCPGKDYWNLLLIPYLLWCIFRLLM